MMATTDYRLRMGLLVAFFIISSVALGIIISEGLLPSRGRIIGSLGKVWNQPTITAGVVAASIQPDSSSLPIIACFSHQDCNDRISSTVDLCRNPGTEFSLCVNKYSSKE